MQAGRLAGARDAAVSGDHPVIKLVVADDQPLVRMGLAVLLDIRMPQLDGIAVLEHVTADPTLAHTRVVMLTIRTVAAGDALLSPTITTRVISRFAGIEHPPRPHPHLDQLTAREREIIARVATGLSNDEIAEQFLLSPATVRTHIGRAMIKLGAPRPSPTRRVRLPDPLVTKPT